MQSQARALDLELSDADLYWAVIAIFRRAHSIYKERGYPTKLMAASMRLGPTTDGVTRVWHLEKLAGADAVMTVFPNAFEAIIKSYSDIPMEPQIDEPVPGDILE